MAPLTPGRRGVDGLLLGAFYLFELCALILAFDLPRLSGRSLRSAIGSAVGVFAILGLLGTVISVLLIVRQHLRARREGVRRFGLTLAINILPLALVIGVGEIVTRILTERTLEGEQFMGTPLVPRDWGYEVARNRDLLDRAKHESPYMVPDQLLGWTVGPARRSKDGLEQSSMEGIRSGRVGVSFAERHSDRRRTPGALGSRNSSDRGRRS